MRHTLLLLLFAQLLVGQTFSVIHKKSLWWDGQGTVRITEEGISYEADKQSESRAWNYQDVQYFDRISEKEFAILTYEDQRLQLGRDRQYKFLITDGELTDEVLRTISARLDRPLTNRVVGEIKSASYKLPVKHTHTFGGCEGTLMFTQDAIYYVTDHREDAREWILDRDVDSVWSTDRHQLEIHAYDNNRREFSRTRVYKFQLKKPLDLNFYSDLKKRLHGLG